MAQVLKPELRERIEAAALRLFADTGYAGTSIASIAASAGTSAANVYRYFPSKEALFSTVVPPDVLTRHDELLDRRIAALADPAQARSPAAEELLEFWLAHRLAIVVILDRAEGTAYADYPRAFVQLLVGHVERVLDAPLSSTQRAVLELVFDNTRRALAHILRRASGENQARAMVAAFWSYQLPGLDGLLGFIRSDVDQSAAPPPFRG